MFELNLQYKAQITKCLDEWQVDTLCDEELIGRKRFQGWAQAMKFATQTVNILNSLAQEVHLKGLREHDHGIVTRLQFNDGWVGVLGASNWKHLKSLVARRVYLRALEVSGGWRYA